MPKQLLNEKYRPDGVDGYLFQDNEVERKVRKWINQKDIPNILFSGSSGTGKSTLSRILVNELEVDPSDVLYVNASLDSGIGLVRERIEPWVKRSSFGGMKIVQLEESDRLSKDAQQALRPIIEDYQHVRFILTCNYPKQLIDPIHSRLQHIQLNSMNDEGIVEHIADIIDSEGLSFQDENDILSHVDAYAPDIRKIINSIDEHTDENNFIHALTQSSSGSDMEEWEELWRSSGGLNLDRAMEVAKLIDQSNFDWFYQVMYENHNKFPDIPSGVVLVSQYLDRAMTSANQPLHLHACLYEMFVINGE